MKNQSPLPSFSALLTSETVNLLSASGADLIQQIGIDVVRGVVLDVLSGRNLRDSTESLTRRRLATLNLATVAMFVNGVSKNPNFISELANSAATVLSSKKKSKAEKWIAQWILGLTDKGVQNILRDNPEALHLYKDKYIDVCSQVIQEAKNQYGDLRGQVQLSPDAKAEISWSFLILLLTTIGSQSLTIRGSEKSSYGKLFEKLILGSMLHILGFRFTTYPPKKSKKVFWLSSKEERRESDATLLYDAGKGVRFDIGFIGRGNTEISLDKVTRFEREIEIGRNHWYLSTIILVDRIGENSRIEKLAEDFGGKIIQMSASYWPKKVAQILHQVLGLNHPLLKMKESEIEQYLKTQLATVPFEQLLQKA
ncbi:MAG: CfrBI family restriction endonuclease [Chlorobi bacterium CHB2]|nr:CfrBI family restriction endonuclease [Chlorobi bacterium CHB2]